MNALTGAHALRPEYDITRKDNWLPHDPSSTNPWGPHGDPFLTDALAHVFCTIFQQFEDEAKNVGNGAERKISLRHTTCVLAYATRFKEDGGFGRYRTARGLTTGPPSVHKSMVILMDYVDGLINEILNFIGGFIGESMPPSIVAQV